MHLKPKQVYYRLFFFIKNLFFKKRFYKIKLPIYDPISWKNNIVHRNTYFNKNNSFEFLNLSHSFFEKIDWNYNCFGKLWTYNLNYFDFLNQESISKEKGIYLINDYIKNDKNLLDGKESYPISLRAINFVKFLSKNKVKNEIIDSHLYYHYKILIKNIEYNILGNHLLENAFSLLFGAYYFQDENFYKKSKNILNVELREQILNDGGHFELSPMYHQIILFRILDCIQLIRLNNWKNDDLESLLNITSSKMLAWLYNITFNNGDIPMVNDSAYQIAPSTKDLLNYANSLIIYRNDIKLFDSGYRMYKNLKYELFMDLSDVKSTYQAGHLHSDNFNFILYLNNQPFIVDTGTSTYEKNKRRQLERSTCSHNTISIGDFDQNEVWGGFRVARRAKILSLIEMENEFSSSHDGYKNIGVIHNRKFIANKDSIHIYDDLNKQDIYKQIAYFHFHPTVKCIAVEDSNVYFKNLNIEISFKGEGISIEKECYKYAHGFNKTENAYKLKVFFKSNLKTMISL